MGRGVSRKQTPEKLGCWTGGVSGCAEEGSEGDSGKKERDSEIWLQGSEAGSLLDRTTSAASDLSLERKSPS